MIWALLCVAADVHVEDITRIAGADNDRCDHCRDVDRPLHQLSPSVSKKVFSIKGFLLGIIYHLSVILTYILLIIVISMIILYQIYKIIN